MASLVQKLKDGAKKAALSGAVGAALSIVFMNGFSTTKVFGNYVPKALVQGVALAGSSYAADLLVPVIVPWVGTKIGQPAALSKFEGVVLSPLIAGVTVLIAETIIAPDLVAQVGGSVPALLTGAGANMVSYYFLDTLGFVTN